MAESPELRGDRLRRLIFAVWLAKKFDPTISRMELAKIAGYRESASTYGVVDWVRFGTDSSAALTEKGKLYLESKILYLHRAIRLMLSSVIVFLSLLIIQRYAYDSFGVILMFDMRSLILAVVSTLFFSIFWYRLLWSISKLRVRK